MNDPPGDKIWSVAYEMRSFFLKVLIPSFFFFISCGPSLNSNHDQAFSPSLAGKIQEQWKSVLGELGPTIPDQLIDEHTPPCQYFDSAQELAEYSEGLREIFINEIGLDLDQFPIASQIQKNHFTADYSISVATLEIFPKILLPINIYIPYDLNINETPLVISPTGCGSSTWSEHVQIRAGNLAKLGMIVVVTEGFCENGARANLSDSNRNFGYARKLMGLKGDVAVYLQELISTINWMLDTFEEIDPDKIAVAGYSYGGQMSLLLAQADHRISSISVPATSIGTPCENFELNSDIWIENSKFWPDHLWSPPLKVPILPINSRMVMAYPRYFHTTSGEQDLGALPTNIQEVINYATEIYSLDNLESRIYFIIDGDGHHYGQNRRENTYQWLNHTLFNDPLGPVDETDIFLQSAQNLVADISQTNLLTDELFEVLDIHNKNRFINSTPNPANQKIIYNEMENSFTGHAFDYSWISTEIWRQLIDNTLIIGRRWEGDFFTFPIFEFENLNLNNGKIVLYLPLWGTEQEIPKILPLLNTYQYVISIDYVGIGELKSDRLLLHTIAKYFMNNSPSLPELNIILLFSFVNGLSEDGLDILANGWSSSFYAAAIKWLDPLKINSLFLVDVPENELEYFKLGIKIPDLLMWNGIFSKLSVREITGLFDTEETIYFDKM